MRPPLKITQTDLTVVSTELDCTVWHTTECHGANVFNIERDGRIRTVVTRSGSPLDVVTRLWEESINL